MEWIALFVLGWIVVCLPAIIITAVANSRRRRETAELNDKVANLTRQLEGLEHRIRAAVAPVQQAGTSAPAVPVKISAEETRVTALPTAPLREPLIVERPVISVTPPPPPPAVAAPIAAQSQTQAQPKPADVGGIPLTPASRPQTTAEPPRAVAPPPKPTVLPPAAVTAPPPPAQRPEHAVPIAQHQLPMPGMNASAQVRASAGSAGFSPAHAARNIQPPKKPGMSLEEAVGTNWLPKLGIAAIVIGVGFLVANKWGDFPAYLRVLILYAGSLAMLAGGIFAERKERYQTLGRALIGGGWAVTVLVTYGLKHAPFMAILSSNALDLFLLMAVIGAMVWHTLKYDSQLVTGAGFLLGFAAITLNPDPPYNLIAGALLVTGMTIIVLRRHWFELEVFGILASYLNHFYWLYSIFGFETTRSPFPHHTVSMLLVIAYWAVFRCSYVWRRVENREEERVSTIAGLLNPLLFLAVMKYQSFHPEWAFYALMVLGATEFVLGQLPVSRRRVAPFRVLSSLGAALMVAGVPFKYSGNSVEMLWLAGAEAFLLAGIFTRERLFRGFGLIISSLVALYVTIARIAPLLQEIFGGQPHHNIQLGIVLGVVAAVLYANAHVIRGRWPELFKADPENQSLHVLSFAASAFAVCAMYTLFADNAVAIMLALFVFALSLLGEQFAIGDLIYQAHWIAVVAFVETIVTGRTLEVSWNGVPGRVLTFVPVAGLLYLSSRYVRLSQTNYNSLFAGGYTWAASSLLVVLIGYEAPEPWIAVAWMGLALLLGSAARFWKDRALLWQTHAVSLLAVGWTLYASFAPQYRGTPVQLVSVAVTACSLYLLNWITNVREIIGNARIAMAYSWAGSLLLSWLIWYQLPAIDVSLVWGIFGLVLFMIGEWKSWSFLRAQAYVALTCSFAHIFYANFNALPAPGAARPEMITVIPLVGIYFFIYWQLHGKKSSQLENRFRIEDPIACLGTATLAALARFELPLDAVAIGYAVLVIATLLAARFTRLQIFVYQALALLGVAAFRVSMHNFYHLHESFSSNLSSSIWTIVLLSAGVPIALSIRRNAAQTFTGPGWATLVASRAEQPMFFVPFVLMAALLAVKVDPGMITLAWGAEAVVVYVLALWAKERSFRLAGLLLLLLCAAKIVLWDIWQLNDPTARYLTLIGVGSLILVVSYLISRNREALRDYL
jgi:hypothetical protein